MRLKQNEEVIRILHHHYMAFILRQLKIAIASIPFFMVAVFISAVFEINLILSLAPVTVLFLMVMLYDGLLFHKDRLIITNYRIVYIDWHGLFIRKEHEAELNDIQDIKTTESGVLSYLPFLDYGTLQIQTASARSIVSFTDAPDPEGIKHFIYHLNVKPNRIKPLDFNTGDDKERQASEKNSTHTPVEH